MSSQPAPAAPCGRRNRTALISTAAGLLAAILVAGWHADEIAEQFSPRPSPDAVSGTWEFDPVRYRAMASEAPCDLAVPMDAAQLEAQVAAATRRYAGFAVHFSPEAVATRMAGAEPRIEACRYRSGHPNSLALEPASGTGTTRLVSLDLRHPGTIYWSADDMTLPLRRR